MGVIDLVVLELDFLVGRLVHLFIFLFCSPDNLFDIEKADGNSSFLLFLVILTFRR